MDKQGFINYLGKKIFYRLAYPKNYAKCKAILFIHGSEFSKSFQTIADRLKSEFICLVFAHLGSGKSEGKFENYSLQSRLEQSVFMFNFLKKRFNLNSGDLAVCGVSMGGHVAARLSEKEKFNYLILRAPASYRKDYENIKMIDGWLPWNMKEKKWPWKSSYSLEAISRFKGNLLLVKCGDDQIIPDEMVQKFFGQAKSAKSRELVTLEGAPHYLSQSPTHTFEFVKIIQKFIQSKS